MSMLTHWTCSTDLDGVTDHATNRLESRSQVDAQLDALRSLAQTRANATGRVVDYSLRYWWEDEYGAGSSVTGSKSPR